MGVTWMLRPTAQGVRVVQHGGDLPGYHSGFLMVPERGFAITMLTNSESGPALLKEFFAEGLGAAPPRRRAATCPPSRGRCPRGRWPATRAAT